MQYFTQIELTEVEAAPEAAIRSSLADGRACSRYLGPSEATAASPGAPSRVQHQHQGIGSMKFHRHLDFGQRAAWHLAHCVRQPGTPHQAEPFARPVEAEETYAEDRAKRTHVKIRRGRNSRRSAVDGAAVADTKGRATDRVAATLLDHTDAATVQALIQRPAMVDEMIYTDGHKALTRLPSLQSVHNSLTEHVSSQAAGGAESFGVRLKLGYYGTNHHMSGKHLRRPVAEFAKRHNRSPLDTEHLVIRTAEATAGKSLPYAELAA